MKKVSTIFIFVGLFISSALADPLDFSSDFTGTDPFGWSDTSGATGTDAATFDPAGSPIQYVQQAVSGGSEDATIDYSFDLDISNLLITGGAGSFLSIFAINADNGNQGPNGFVGGINGISGARTEIRLVNWSSQGQWRIVLRSGGIFGGTGDSGFSTLLTLSETDEQNLHFEGTATLTDTGTVNTLDVTAGSQSFSTLTSSAAGSGLGGDHVNAYTLGTLQYQNAYTGALSFDNFNASVVPEPSTATLLFGGLGMLLYMRRRRRS